MNRFDRRTVISLLIGLGAVIAVMSVWGLGNRDKTPEKVSILVATQPLPAWAPIPESAITERQIPYKAYRRGAYYTSKAQVVGRRPVVDIQRGQVLRPEMFEVRNGDISKLLPPGTVAYSFSLEGNHVRIPHAIAVGDRVDLLVEIRSKALNDTFVLTVAEDLRVVNIERGIPKDEESSVERVTRENSLLNTVTSRTKRSSPLVPRAVVLAVTRKQAQDIELARGAGGTFTLILRAQQPGDSQPYETSQPRTLSEFLREKGLNIEVTGSSPTRPQASAPTVTIVRGVEVKQIPIQKVPPK